MTLNMNDLVFRSDVGGRFSSFGRVSQMRRSIYSCEILDEQNAVPLFFNSFRAAKNAILL
jgi:hypothetical protein